MKQAQIGLQPQSPLQSPPQSPLPSPDETCAQSARTFEAPTFDARKQLEHLAQAAKDFSHAPQPSPEPPPQAAPSIAPPASPAPKPGFSLSKHKISLIVKTSVGLAVVASLGLAPLQRLMITTSTEAVVNARLVILRAPIEGLIRAEASALEIGAPFESGQIVLSIDNPRLDSGPVRRLRQAQAQAQGVLAALSARQQALESRAAELERQKQVFLAGRKAQLTHRLDDLDAQIFGAQALQEETLKALARVTTLHSAGYATQAMLEKAEREHRVAHHAVAALTARRSADSVELEAVEKGVFIGDSYNDTPQSFQRAGDIAVERADIDSRIASAREELKRIEASLQEELAFYAQETHAQVAASSSARVWEAMVSPGEHVNKGQDLLKLVDCGGGVVTAGVTENAYQTLKIGQGATFQPREGGAALKGWVVGLNGPAAIASNSAIHQSALTRAAFRVSVKFPDLAHGAECGLGRTGLVSFEKAS